MRTLETTEPIPLDCGHMESPHSSITRGYGTDKDGRRHCYDCCAEQDKRYMQEHGYLSAYLSGDGKHITTWPGTALANVTREWHTSAGGFAGRTTITRVWAKATDGSWWHGRGPGRGMYIRMRRSSAKRFTVGDRS